ncbi:hypothetical protein G9C85_00185 [Halorubellus sp. JP-L1]|uniref:hypothetical protein n=1 Tax=Halorubellus sp. JP-L1 TaxID=2715753 RepID=UPI001408956B|nr:hypothetical protein [Halorubellus sp. JP-L1]NHN40056.1 hypothetical protein [Halorubellus sp. JP-L1]
MATDWIAQYERIKTAVGGDGGPSAVIQRVLLLPIIAFGLQTANIIEAVTSFFIEPTTALIGGISNDVIGELLGGVGNILGAGAGASADGVDAFWVLGFPASIAVILAGGYLVARYLSEDSTGDTIPFSFTDFPLIGTEEDSDS